MSKPRASIVADLQSDPFAERPVARLRERMQLLGCRVEFESNSRQLLELVRIAYAGCRAKGCPPGAPRLKITLRLTSGTAFHGRSEPPQLEMISGGGFLGGTTASSRFRSYFAGRARCARGRVAGNAAISVPHAI